MGKGVVYLKARFLPTLLQSVKTVLFNKPPIRYQVWSCRPSDHPTKSGQVIAPSVTQTRLNQIHRIAFHIVVAVNVSHGYSATLVSS